MQAKMLTFSTPCAEQLQKTEKQYLVYAEPPSASDKVTYRLCKMTIKIQAAGRARHRVMLLSDGRKQTRPAAPFLPILFKAAITSTSLTAQSAMGLYNADREKSNISHNL